MGAQGGIQRGVAPLILSIISVSLRFDNLANKINGSRDAPAQPAGEPSRFSSGTAVRRPATRPRIVSAIHIDFGMRYGIAEC